MSAATPTTPGIEGVSKYMSMALVAGAAGLGVSALGYLASKEDFFRAYLVAWCFCMGISLGSLALLMLQHMTGGAWGLALRRLLEAAASPVVLLAQAVLFLPLILGLDNGNLYPWVTPGDDPILQGRQPYMNVPLFLGRFGLFFAIWIGIATCLSAWSAKEDKTSDPAGVSKLGETFRTLCGPGLLIYALTMTFAAVDWGMSINEHWYSTMYGVLFSFGPLLTALTFLVACLALLLPVTRLSAIVDKKTLADLGSLMLAFTMFWAYISFSQYLLIWSANLKTEVPYYVYRTTGVYAWMGLFLVLGHFVLPFLVLLTYDGKRNPRVLLCVALWLLAMRFLDYYWTIGPTLTNREATPAALRGFNPAMLWLDAATLVGTVGVIVGLFLWQLQRQPIVPEHDPRLAEVGGHAHG